MRLGYAPALALIVSCPAAAQSTGGLRELTTDRPDKTESPITVDAGHAQVELDLATYTRDREQGVLTETLNVTPINLKYGVSGDTDVQLIVGGYLRQSAGGRTIDGIGDVTLRLKHNLWGNDGGDTAFGLIPFVILPTARNGLGSGHVEGGVIAPFSVKLAETFDLGVMTEVDVVRRDDDAGYTASFVNSVTLGHDLTDTLGMYVELFTEKAARGGAGWNVTGDVGITLALGDSAQLDTGVNVGLSEAADDLNVFVGYSRRF